MTGLLPYASQAELVDEMNRGRAMFSQWVNYFAKKSRPPSGRPYAQSTMGEISQAPPEVQTLYRWAHAAPWLPRDVLVPLAKQGVEPDSDLGLQVIKHSPTLRGPAHVTVNAAGHQGSLTAQAGVESPSVLQAGIGDIGGGLGRIGSAIGAVTRPVRQGLQFSSAQQEITAERTHLPRVDVPVKKASRYVTAGLQSGAEALDTALTYRSPYAGQDFISRDTYQAPTRNPFDLNQFTLSQLLQHPGEQGTGFFPSHEIQQRAAEVQREVRGTIGGSAKTPGRVFASQIFEPGSHAYSTVSGLVDASIDWKLDPAAFALTELGDVNQARKAFDTYGAVQGQRNWVYRKLFDTSLDSDRLRPTLEQMAASKNPREIWHALGKKPGTLTLAKDLASMSTVDGVKDILKLHADEVPTIGKWGYNFSYPLSSLRWAQAMPSGTIDVTDVDNAALQLERLLITSKVDPKIIDRVVSEVASVGADRNKLADIAFHTASDAMRQTLVDSYAVRPATAKKISRFFQDKFETDRVFHIEEMSNSPHQLALTLGDTVVPITGPVAPSQMLNGAIPLPNPRALRAAASKFKPLLELPGVEPTHTFLDFFTDSVFKVGALMRFAWPVRVIAEEQIRMATAGLDSLFNHPINWIAYAVGRKGATDVYEVPWGQTADDALSHVLGKARTYRGPGAGALDDADKVYAKHWEVFGQDSDHFSPKWAEELSFHHMDPISHATAKAIKNGTVDELKNELWDGKLSKVRQDIVNGGGWRTNLATREGSDSYIEDVMVPWVRRVTHDHQDLLDAVVDGGIHKNNRINRDIVRKLEDYTEQGLAPDSVLGQAVTNVAGSKGERIAAGYNHAVDTMFSFLMSKPTNFLSRSPAFEQFYWQKIGDIYDNADSETQRQLLRVANNTRVDANVIGKMRASSRSGKVGLEAVDTYAKAAAIDATKSLLYDVSQRSHFFDAMRIVFPFGEAWKEVLSVWAKLAREQPQVVRRAQQIMQGARGSGFFYTDPQDGNEYYTIPFSQQVNKFFTGVPFAQRSQVAGLNIIGQGLPGVGPAVQIPLTAMIPDKPQWDAIHELVSPYGSPDNLGAFLPGWAQKLQATDWLKGTPVIGNALEPLRVAFPQSENQKRVFEGTVEYVLGNMISSGAFDVNNPDDWARALQSAKKKAVGLYALRSASQSVSPSAPGFVPKAKAKDGKLYEFWSMATHLRDLTDKYGLDDGTKRFIDQYGEKAFLAVTPHTTERVYMPPTSKQGSRWQAAHQQFVDAFPDVAGFFAPGSNDFNYNEYLRQLDSGARETFTPRDWLEAGNHRLASHIYAQQRSKYIGALGDPNVSSSDKKAIRKYLSDYQTYLKNDYPGYDPEGTHGGKDISPEKARIQLLQAASDKKHKDVYNSQFAKALREYYKYRQQAVDAAKEGGVTLAAKAAAPLRDWLRQWGEEISARSPAFQNAWDRLLYPEVEEQNDQTAAS